MLKILIRLYLRQVNRDSSISTISPGPLIWQGWPESVQRRHLGRIGSNQLRFVLNQLTPR